MLRDRAGRMAGLVYDLMTIEDIQKLPVGEVAEEEAHVWVWAVNQYLEEALQCVRLWGFTKLGIITYKKPSGLGSYFVNLTEHLIFGYKGKCKFNKRRYIPNAFDVEWPDLAERQEEARQSLDDLFLNKMPIDLWVDRKFPKRHSRKPEQSYSLIEETSEPRFLEIFARPISPLFPARPGWKQLGNEIDGKDIRLSLQELIDAGKLFDQAAAAAGSGSELEREGAIL